MIASFEGHDDVLCDYLDNLRIDRLTNGCQVSNMDSDQQAFCGSIEQLPVY